MHNGQKVLRQLHIFDSFHEEAFLSRRLSPVSVQAVSYCELMVLTVEAFSEAKLKHPSLDNLLQVNYQDFHSQVTKAAAPKKRSWIFVRKSQSSAHVLHPDLSLNEAERSDSIDKEKSWSIGKVRIRRTSRGKALSTASSPSDAPPRSPMRRQSSTHDRSKTSSA